MVPIADMMNYKSEPNAKLHVEKKGCMVNALRNIEKGEEIYLCY